MIKVKVRILEKAMMFDLFLELKQGRKDAILNIGQHSWVQLQPFSKSYSYQYNILHIQIILQISFRLFPAKKAKRANTMFNFSGIIQSMHKQV